MTRINLQNVTVSLRTLPNDRRTTTEQQWSVLTPVLSTSNGEWPKAVLIQIPLLINPQPLINHINIQRSALSYPFLSFQYGHGSWKLFIFRTTGSHKSNIAMFNERNPGLSICVDVELLRHFLRLLFSDFLLSRTPK